MQLTKAFREKRAVTSVLSSLLLTIVAVAAMSLATAATYVITTNMRESMSERLVVEDVWFNKHTGTIDIYLSNTGKVAVHVSNVYVNHSAQVFNTPFQLALSSSSWLHVNASWNTGDLYYIDVVTSRGMHIASYYKTP